MMYGKTNAIGMHGLIATIALITAAGLSFASEPVPAFIFGQNLEHTRAAVEGGISAQLVKNRKFAGKPARNGVAAYWEGYGKRAAFEHLDRLGYTHHASPIAAFKLNEIASQFIQSLDETGAGILQRGLVIRGGVGHRFRAMVRTPNPVETSFVVCMRAEGKELARHSCTVRSADKDDWQEISFPFKVEKNTLADLSISVEGHACAVIGVVSVLPDDHFHGMRHDVVECLKEIGTSIVRWPGGNFAGEYRWRDGLIADRDARAPLQSYLQLATQPYSLGYDQNDLSFEDVLALCAELDAKPFFTINPVWDKPADSAEWVKRCNGRVKDWSLGNEMGFVHMEGPKGPANYVKLVAPHAEAMQAVDPELRLTGSGEYPGRGRKWIEGAAVPLAPLAPCVACHHYQMPGFLDFTSPEHLADTYARVAYGVDDFFRGISRFRAELPREISISLDEWNLWYAWYREDGVVEGLFAAKMLHGLMRRWKELGLQYVCYFQAVNENAIHVDPFSCRLTSIGEAMRLMKEHVGRTPVHSQSDEVFVTRGEDGTYYATVYNFSPVKTRTFTLPADGTMQNGACELLQPNGLETGCRYERTTAKINAADGILAVELPPASLAAVRYKTK